jgi:hypothetical protein
VVLLLTVPHARGVNIAWVSVQDSDTANAAAQGFGFTDAPDQGYVDLLRDAGHTVTRVVEQSPTAAYAANLSDNFDLVIAGRQVNSPNFQDEAERALWHGITTPMIFMSGYVIRGGTDGNSRLQFTTGSTIPDASNQGPVTLTAAVPGHEIFQGITLGAGNTLPFAEYPVFTPNGDLQRGISVNNNTLNGGGTVLARVGTPGDPALNGPLIAHWSAGAQLGNHALAAPRMIFMSGSREHDGGGVPTAGVFDLTTVGSELFLNSVDFMTQAPPLLGDTDGNGTVDLADFEPIRANFRKTVTARNQGDLVANGVVDFADFREWKAAFTGAGGSLAGLNLSFGTNVPEPSTFGLVCLAVGGLAGKRSRGVAMHPGS